MPQNLVYKGITGSLSSLEPFLMKAVQENKKSAVLRRYPQYENLNKQAKVNKIYGLHKKNER